MSPVGFIGLGAMGLPMARSLLAAGHRVLACDTAAQARDALREGAPADALQFAETPAAIADQAGIIVLMLPTSAVVAQVMEGVDGILGAVRPGGLVIDMGSSVPAETRRLAALAAARDATLIDAPVSGSVTKARAGTLTIMVGGDDDAFGRAEPVLRGMGDTLIRCGAVGAAHAMKALNNYVYAAGLLALSEALQMGARIGLDLGVLTDVMNASSGRNLATETKAKQDIISGRYAGGFQLGLMAKDLATAGAIAAETNVDARLLALCDRLWRDAVDAIGPGSDNTAIHRYLESRATARRPA